MHNHGQRLTVSDASGYGTGGTAGIYQVALDGSMPSNCGLILAAAQNPLPPGVATDSLPAAPSSTDRNTASLTGTGRPTNSASVASGSSSGLSGGAIAGIVIGVLAALLLLFLLLFCLYRRRKNRDGERLPDQEIKPSEVDMHETQSPIPNYAQNSYTNRNSMSGIPASISRNLTYGHGHSRNTSTSTPQLANFGGYEQAEVPRDAQPTLVPFTSPQPQSASMSPTTSDEQHNNESTPNRRSKLAMSMSSQPTFRVSNDYPEGQSSRYQDAAAAAASRRSTMDLSSHEIPEDDATTHYRRLTDGGRFVGSPEDVGRTVDLPPLYNDIPRDDNEVERR